MVNYNESLSMATQTDPFQQFLASIGANRLDSAGRPIGSTGGAVAINQDQERQLAQFRAPAQASGGPVAPAALAQGQAGPAQANPLDFLNKTFGTNFGAPTQNMATRQATDAQPAMRQLAGSFEQMGDVRQAAIVAKQIQDAGINLDPTQPGYEAQQRAAEGIWRRVNAAKQPGQENSFLPPGNAYMGGGPAPTGADVLAAGGQPVTGYGGTQISGQRGPNGNNQFFLKQGPQPPAGLNSRPTPVTSRSPSQAAMDLLGVPLDRRPSGVDTNPPVQTPAQAPIDPLKAAQSDYRNAVAAAGSRGPKLALEQGFMEDPNRPGSTIPIPGSDAERKRQTEAAVNQTRDTQAWDQANSVVSRVNQILPRLNSLTTGPMAALTKGIPGAPAFNVEEMKKPIQSALTLDTIADMRAASKNGASGLGQITEKELNMLNTAVENLNLAQGEDAVRKALINVRNSFIRAKAGMEAGRLDPNDQKGAYRIAAVKWALANPNNPKAEQILTLENN
jgi:hypothetical protein